MSSHLLLSFTPTRTQLHLIGEFDVAQRRVVRRQVADALTLSDEDLELDASRVTFVDCGTLWELARAGQQFAARGRRLRVRAASPIFSRVAFLAAYPELLPDSSDRPPSVQPGARSVAVLWRPGRRRR